MIGGCSAIGLANRLETAIQNPKIVIFAFSKIQALAAHGCFSMSGKQAAAKALQGSTAMVGGNHLLVFEVDIAKSKSLPDSDSQPLAWPLWITYNFKLLVKFAASWRP